jgi:hypothetical protein
VTPKAVDLSLVCLVLIFCIVAGCALYGNKEAAASGKQTTTVVDTSVNKK